MKHLALVEGEANLLSKNEILISKEEDYTILRKRLDNGDIETYVVVPLKDFKKNGDNTEQKVEEV
jgi:hypothetical protein